MREDARDGVLPVLRPLPSRPHALEVRGLSSCRCSSYFRSSIHGNGRRMLLWTSLRALFRLHHQMPALPGMRGRQRNAARIGQLMNLSASPPAAAGPSYCARPTRGAFFPRLLGRGQLDLSLISCRVSTRMSKTRSPNRLMWTGGGFRMAHAGAFATSPMRCVGGGRVVSDSRGGVMIFPHWRLSVAVHVTGTEGAGRMSDGQTHRRVSFEEAIKAPGTGV